MLTGLNSNAKDDRDTQYMSVQNAMITQEKLLFVIPTTTLSHFSSYYFLHYNLIGISVCQVKSVLKSIQGQEIPQCFFNNPHRFVTFTKIFLRLDATYSLLFPLSFSCSRAPDKRPLIISK